MKWKWKPPAVLGMLAGTKRLDWIDRTLQHKPPLTCSREHVPKTWDWLIHKPSHSCQSGLSWSCLETNHWMCVAFSAKLNYRSEEKAFRQHSLIESVRARENLLIAAGAPVRQSEAVITLGCCRLASCCHICLYHYHNVQSIWCNSKQITV